MMRSIGDENSVQFQITRFGDMYWLDGRCRLRFLGLSAKSALKVIDLLVHIISKYVHESHLNGAGLVAGA